MDVRVDLHELLGLVGNLHEAPEKVVEELKKVTGKGALRIKQGAQRRVSGLAHAPAYPRSIGYDPVRVTALRVSTEIGPDKNRRQGALGNILEFGTVNNAPIPHLAPALEVEAPVYERYVADAGVKALEL